MYLKERSRCHPQVKPPATYFPFRITLHSISLCSALDGQFCSNNKQKIRVGLRHLQQEALIEYPQVPQVGIDASRFVYVTSYGPQLGH